MHMPHSVVKTVMYSEGNISFMFGTLPDSVLCISLLGRF